MGNGSFIAVCLSTLQGTGRYAVYVANYASGNVAPHALIEMDETASNVAEGIIALSNVAAEAGVNKLAGAGRNDNLCREVKCVERIGLNRYGSL